MVQTDIYCKKCGSAAIRPPLPLRDEATVTCRQCAFHFGTWADYKLRISREIARSQPCTSCDPQLPWDIALRSSSSDIEDRGLRLGK
jgi:hypothetical protein